jgi:hypothetical protein
MRSLILAGLGSLVLFAAPAKAQQQPEPPIRFGVHADLKDYPQATPQDGLASVLAALDNGRVDYLLAQLTEPAFVDRRIKQVYGGEFDEFVREATTKMNDSPDSVKELRRFLKEGEWTKGETTASAGLKDIRDRKVFFRKVGDRWYFENRQRPEPPPPSDR